MRKGGISSLAVLLVSVFLPPATKLRQGNDFTPVCHSVYRGRSVCHTPPLGRHPLGIHPSWIDTPCPVHAGIHTPLPSACWDTHLPGRHPQGDTPPAQCMLGYTHTCMRGYTHLPSACWDTVNKRAVRILLECILVCICFRNLVDSHQKRGDVNFTQKNNWREIMFDTTLQISKLFPDC